MNITLSDFFETYPEINVNENDLLNPYSEQFNQVIYNKKEFNELKLNRTENKPELGELYDHQKIISRFFSSHTPYTGLLLLHEMGTGKTCSLFGATEQLKTEGIYKKVYILTRNPRLLKNLKSELAYVCTKKIYLPEEQNLTELETRQRINKLTGKFYEFVSFDEMKKTLRNMTDAQIIERYSNSAFGIDEVHNLKLYGEGNNTSSEDYNQIHRLVHIAKNIKVLLMSGTPMTDHPSEIAQMLNLILPLDQQLLTGNNFSEKFLYSKNGINYIKQNEKAYLKNVMKGRVSYLKTMVSDVEVAYEGKSIGGLQLFKVIDSEMSTFQTKYYTEALDKDLATGAKDGEHSDDEEEAGSPAKKKVRTAGVYSSSRQATLFVFPDGSYGSAGFKKYIDRMERKPLGGGAKVISYKLKDELKSQLFVAGDVKKTIENIRKCSAVYANTLEHILDSPDKLHFIYGKLIEGSGNILFACLLELVGYVRGSVDDTRTRKSYFNVTRNIYSDDQIKNIIRYYSSPGNMEGKFANVLISSKILSEGFTIKNIQRIHVLTPHWNFSELAQAIARGIRLNAHNDLINAQKNPKIKIYLHVGIPKGKIKSLDLDKYIISEQKDVAMKDVERLIKEAAFDCALFRDRNYNPSLKDNSRECEYQKCNYTCDGITTYNSDIDYSTYNLYYSDKDVDNIISDIKFFFGIEFQTYTSTLITNFNNKGYTTFVILKAINNMINTNTEIRNKYNIVSYLRESDNILYIIDTISMNAVFSQCSYTKLLAVKDSMSYSEALNDLCIDMVCQNKSDKTYLNELSFLLKQYICEEFISHPEIADKNKHIKTFFKIKGTNYTIDDTKYSKGMVKIGSERLSPPKPVEIVEAEHGYSGKYNDDFFCIKSNKVVKDRREKPTGRTCPASWHVDQLCRIAVELELPYENNNNKYKNISTLKKPFILEEFKDLTKIKKHIEEFSKLEVENLRRILYYATSAKQVSCDAIKKYFEENHLLKYDEMCGKPGVKRTEE